MKRGALAGLLALAALASACGGGGGGSNAGGDQAVCDAALEAGEAAFGDQYDEERLLEAMEAADQFSVDAQDDLLARIAEEAGIVALTMRAAIEEQGDVSDDLFTEMTTVVEDLDSQCQELGL